MYCPNCGTPIPEDSVFCMACGTRLSIQPSNQQCSFSSNKKSNRKLTASILIALFLCVGLICGITAICKESAKKSLQKELLRDWSRVEEGSSGSLYTLELDFSADTIEYIYDCAWFRKEVTTYDYEIVSGNKIKQKGLDTVYTIEFNDEKTMMTITPALTQSDSFEHWFNHD